MTNKEIKKELKDAFGYVGMPFVVNMLAEIIEEVGSEWSDKDMKAICTRDANILRDAAREISKPLKH
jgi:hypothetical protein